MVCGVGLLHAEVKSDSIASEIVSFHQNSFFINLGDFYCHILDNVIEGELDREP